MTVMYLVSVIFRIAGLIGVTYAAVMAIASSDYVLAFIIVIATLAIFTGVGLAHEPEIRRRR